MDGHLKSYSPTCPMVSPRDPVDRIRESSRTDRGVGLGRGIPGLAPFPAAGARGLSARASHI